MVTTDWSLRIFGMKIQSPHKADYIRLFCVLPKQTVITMLVVLLGTVVAFYAFQSMFINMPLIVSYNKPIRYIGLIIMR